MAKVKDDTKTLNDIIKEKYDYLKQGDFSVLTDEETTQFLKFIGSFVYKNPYFKINEKEDVTYDIFHNIIDDKLANMDIDNFENTTTYLGFLVRREIRNIVAYRNTLKRQGDFNKDSLNETLQSQKSNKPKEKFGLIKSNEKTPLEQVLFEEKMQKYDTVKKYFEKYPYLNMYYTQGVTFQEIGDEYGVTRETIRIKLNRERAFVKIDMAEDGIFDLLETKNDENKYLYDYIKKRIAKDGITSVYVNDEVDLKTLADIFGESENNVYGRIKQDFYKVYDIIDEVCHLNVPKTNRTAIVKVYVNIFDKYIKNFDKVPKDIIYETNLMIKNTKGKTFVKNMYAEGAINAYVKNNSITKEEFMNIANSYLETVKNTTQKRLKAYEKQALKGEEFLTKDK